MRYRKWHPRYDRLVQEFVRQHFGSWNGMIRLFSSDKPINLKWSDKSVDPADVYMVKKMANEYHGLERHAHQYHTCAMYEYAYHHWLMAAAWRKETMEIHNFTDDKHKLAIHFDLGCAAYNLALNDWFVEKRSYRKTMPQPYQFGIKESIIVKKDLTAEDQLRAVVNR